MTRILNDFADRGLVRLGRKRIAVLDRDGLRQVLETSPASGPKTKPLSEKSGV